MNNILEVSNINKSYNSLDGEINTIDNTSFNIEEGEFVSLVGPSGCGKSTLLNILTNLDKDYTGNIKLNKNTHIGYMLQTDSLFPWLTVLDNTLIGLKIQNKYTIENINYVKNLLKKYGLKDFMNKKINSLSGGMKQRVA